MPFFFEAAILSRMRSPVTSRSNWAKDNSTLSVRRPIELLVLLAADVRLTSFALRRERIEFLLEPFLGGFAGVDRATSAARISSRHRRPLRLNVVPARAREQRCGSASIRRRAVPTTLCR